MTEKDETEQQYLESLKILEDEILLEIKSNYESRRLQEINRQKTDEELLIKVTEFIRDANVFFKVYIKLVRSVCRHIALKHYRRYNESYQDFYSTLYSSSFLTIKKALKTYNDDSIINTAKVSTYIYSCLNKGLLQDAGYLKIKTVMKYELSVDFNDRSVNSTMLICEHDDEKRWLEEEFSELSDFSRTFLKKALTGLYEDANIYRKIGLRPLVELVRKELNISRRKTTKHFEELVKFVEDNTNKQYISLVDRRIKWKI